MGRRETAKLLLDAAKLADEYAVLYKPFKLVDHAFSPKSEDKADKISDCGKCQQNFKDKGNNTKPFVQN